MIGHHKAITLLALMVLLVTLTSAKGKRKCLPHEFPQGDDLYKTDTFNVQLNDDFAAQSISYDTLVTLNVYQHNAEGCWVSIQTFSKLGCQWAEAAKSVDVNGDNCDDIILLRTFGSRGGNVYAYVFLFDHTKGMYYYLKGSAEHPNLEYDPEDGLIRETGYTASIHYVWYKVENDSLVGVKGYDHEVDDSSAEFRMRGVLYTFSKTGDKVITYIDNNPPGCMH